MEPAADVELLRSVGLDKCLGRTVTRGWRSQAAWVCLPRYQHSALQAPARGMSPSDIAPSLNAVSKRSPSLPGAQIRILRPCFITLRLLHGAQSSCQ